MSVLRSYFDRVAVISLPERNERRERLKENLKRAGLAEAGEVAWVEAVDGKNIEVPEWTEIGPGGWGCRASHLEVIQAAQQDGMESILIIEDDAVFSEHASEALTGLMPLLPDDWGVFFLGGQHMVKPKKTKHPALLKGKFITRTHTYAVHRRAFDGLIEEIGNDDDYRCNPTMHLDHQLGSLQEEGLLNAYAPSWWITGQVAGPSDISAMDLPLRWWHPRDHYLVLPFVMASAGLEDSGLLYRSEKKFPSSNIKAFHWLGQTAFYALMEGKLPMCPRNWKRVKKLWPAGTREVGSERQLQEVADYPYKLLMRDLKASIL